MVKRTKERNLVNHRLEAAHNLTVGQKVWRETKERLYFGTIESISANIGDVFVNWFGLGVRPESPESLNDATEYDSFVELIVDRFFMTNPDELVETIFLADILKIPVGGVEAALDLAQIEAALDRLKEKKKVVWMAGLWKKQRATGNGAEEEGGGLSRHEEVIENKIANYERAVRFAIKDSESIELIPLNELTIDLSLQSRAAIDWKHVEILREQIRDGKKIEPIEVMKLPDGSLYPYHGFHRYFAHEKEEAEVISAIVMEGDRRTAILLSVGCNADNKPQLARSNKDKHHSVMMLLNDSEWQKWSDVQIAKICKVSDKTVAKIRKDATSEFRGCMSERLYQKNGKTEKMTFFKFGDRVLHGDLAATVLKVGKKFVDIGYEDSHEIIEVSKKELKTAKTKDSNFSRGEIVTHPSLYSLTDEEKASGCFLEIKEKAVFEFLYAIDDGYSVLYDRNKETGSNIFIAPTEKLQKIVSSTTSQAVEINADEWIFGFKQMFDRFDDRQLEFLVEVISNSDNGGKLINFLTKKSSARAIKKQ